ncbi:amidase signature enzyme [Fistulina hepatica ATCC 64428]|uniref:Glutamyl-tRNA(Gln) amidotransferase subunit A, mitochondrial n=1 Tax=Fistulina hepatica ATCC 64428 TaxID=1128425 RepID=A0A0D7A992_9AGAR|nr:amidase signature enzyme [Fistulina hepatica ATCC 64428]
MLSLKPTSTQARNVARIVVRTRSCTTVKQPIQDDVNAFVHIAPVSSHHPAEDDASNIRPLSGYTVALKANICTKDMPTTCSSDILRNFISPYNATVTTLLRSNGANIVGKTNCDEFGMGSLNTHSVHGPVINPFRPAERRSAGGSSGGSAAAVAANFCDVALGTDTGGSVRLPASYCGVVGLKPSYGLISRYGVVSYADSLDCVGILAKRVGSVKRVFDVLSAYDNNDPTTIPSSIRDAARELLHRRGSGLRIGIPQEYFPAELSPAVLQPLRRVVSTLKKLGVDIVPVSLPSTPYALSAYYVIATAEASSNLARYDGIQYGTRKTPPPQVDATKTSNIYAYTRSACFGPEVRKRILLGTYALSADAFDNYFLKAQSIRRRIKADFDNVFALPDARAIYMQAGAVDIRDEGVDVLIHPSAIQEAPALPDAGEKETEADGLQTYVQDVMTVPASLAGLPAMSVPMPRSSPDEWPVGLSIVSQWGAEEAVTRVGQLIQSLSSNASETA